MTSCRTATNFVDIVYKGALSGFYFLHDHPNDMILMEDGAPVCCSALPKGGEKLIAYQN